MSSFKFNDAVDDIAGSIINGNENVFQDIWDRFNLPIRKFIYDMCGNYELTEELAQETFVRAFKGIKKYRHETKFSSWIFGIAKNVVWESSRRLRKAGRNVEIEEAEFSVFPEEKSSPELLLIEAETLSAVYKALDKIDQEQRLSFVLRLFHNKSHVEIAEITGFSVAKIKVDIYRTRKKLRKLLSPFIGKNDEL